MSAAGLEYTGLDILRALEEARNYNRSLADLCERAAGTARVVVDFGAGIGTFSDLLQDRGFAVRCVEPDGHLASRLREKGYETFTDLAELPDGSIAYAYTLNVFEHIEDDRTALRALVAKLRPGARLLIYVPAFAALWTGLDDRVRHYRRYTRATLGALAASAGLQVDECRYADSLGFFATIAFRLIGDKGGNISPAAIKAYDRFAIPLSMALDKITAPFFGKNDYAICTKA